MSSSTVVTDEAPTGDDGTYSGRVVDVYDLLYPDLLGDIPQLSAFIERAAPGRRILEFGVGTGRIAIPLADAGFDVTGTDISAAMLARLREKDPTGRVETAKQSFIDDVTDGAFDAVLLMINTIFVAHTLDQQIAIFRNAAAALVENGLFVIETFNPLRFQDGGASTMSMRNLSQDVVLLEQYTIDQPSQFFVANNLVFDHGEQFSYTQVLRYMFPSEMDAVARNADLVLAARMSDWNGAPYAADSNRCISVYGRA